jgi:hypothetical protein
MPIWRPGGFAGGPLFEAPATTLADLNRWGVAKC